MVVYGEDGEEREQAQVAPSRPGAPSAQLKIFEDGPGQYRAVVLIRTVKHGTFCLRVLFERVPDDFDGEAVAGEFERAFVRPHARKFGFRGKRRRELGGAASGFDVTETAKKAAHPVLEAITSVLDHPLAAMAAAATLLVPGWGPAYLVTYAIGQSVFNYAERKTRA